MRHTFVIFIAIIIFSALGLAGENAEVSDNYSAKNENDPVVQVEGALLASTLLFSPFYYARSTEEVMLEKAKSKVQEERNLIKSGKGSQFNLDEAVANYRAAKRAYSKAQLLEKPNYRRGRFMAYFWGTEILLGADLLRRVNLQSKEETPHSLSSPVEEDGSQRTLFPQNRDPIPHHNRPHESH